MAATKGRNAEPDFREIADYGSVMAHAKRLAILWLLGEGDLSVGEIADHIGVSMQNASQHLRVMRDRGAVVNRQEAQTVLYQISNRKFLTASRLIRVALQEQSTKTAQQRQRKGRA